MLPLRSFRGTLSPSTGDREIVALSQLQDMFRRKTGTQINGVAIGIGAAAGRGSAMATPPRCQPRGGAASVRSATARSGPVPASSGWPRSPSARSVLTIRKGVRLMIL